MNLPFVLDRTLNMSLAEQMFQGLKKSIVRGAYRPGEMLPGIHELANAAYEGRPDEAVLELATWLARRSGTR